MSTTEVAEAVSTYPGVEEVNVYGVEVPHQDGRACCAAMVLADNIDFAGLYATCQKNLPSYAVPLFIRKLPKIDITVSLTHPCPLSLFLFMLIFTCCQLTCRVHSNTKKWNYVTKVSILPNACPMANKISSLCTFTPCNFLSYYVN